MARSVELSSLPSELQSLLDVMGPVRPKMYNEIDALIDYCIQHSTSHE